MDRWILQFIRFQIDLSVTNGKVGEEFGETNRCIGVKGQRVVQGKSDLLHLARIVARSGIEQELLNFAIRTKTGLVETNAAVKQGIVHHDLFLLYIFSA